MLTELHLPIHSQKMTNFAPDKKPLPTAGLRLTAQEGFSKTTKPKAPVSNNILDSIGSPADLRKLPVEQLPQLCEEIRQYIIANCAHNPGHFASSMGAVEIAVALHYTMQTPDDRIVWDVGHQAYAHKILTGRKDNFEKLRSLDGPSGFPSPLESPYDTFAAGHASNSISAALGMAIADSQTLGREERKTVAVIGDASISGGLAFEGLNNASMERNNLLIVLNDNDMSIDPNVGALHRYLSGINTSEAYNRWRARLYTAMRKRGLISDNGRGMVMRFNNAIKSLLTGRQNIFEGLNIRYFGPFDGHDVKRLVKVINEIKDMSGPRLLHLRTVKGKGFPVAEQNPAAWHAPGRFDPATGEKIKSEKPTKEKWQDVFGKKLVELASKDDRVVGITAGMLSGTSVGLLQKSFPDRTFDVGISEGHAVTFAGGLATAGKRPYVAIYSAFLQRAYDNIINDVAICGLPVTFCIDRAGLVGEDGVTHHGLFDLCYLKCIPGMTVAAPMDARSLRALLDFSLGFDKPLAIRYPRGIAEEGDAEVEIIPGKSRRISEGKEGGVAVLTLGAIGAETDSLIKKLESEGIKAAHYDMIWLKPLDSSAIAEVARRYKAVLTIEDGSLTGGFGDEAEMALRAAGFTGKVEKLGVPDKWINHGTPEELRHICGFDGPAIEAALKRLHNDLNLK